MGTGVNLWQPWPLRDLVVDLRQGRTTQEAAAARSRDRIAATEPELAAWVARHDTPTVPVPGPLGGVPLGVKDIIDVAGYPTKCGSALRADIAAADRDAAIVSAWRATGAVPVGKTVTTEFAFFAPGPTHNPADTAHTPGGSSSGSAAAVASGQVPLALGSQTAASVTRPAAYCGVASLVMSRGRYPVDGVVGLSPSLDSHGVFAARVSDLAVAWSALTGADDAGVRAVRPPRLLLWTAEPLGVVSDEMGAALEATATALRAAGATVDAFPREDLIAEITTAHPVIMAFEAAVERAGELAQADSLSAPLANLLRTGARTAPSLYTAARRTVAAALAEVTEVMSGYDAVLGPAAPGAAPVGLASTGDPVLSRAWQALGLPAVAVPGLRDPAGLPLGLQVIGPPGGELDALMAGCWIEKRLGRSLIRL
ncbi:amidase family protein [Nocardia alni]|uniref:amidase family protein n=1 Tax=Nocardia alni TaxID=2815723 RepID=UPI001C224F9D|nr:amidase [Nocardia alni]